MCVCVCACMCVHACVCIGMIKIAIGGRNVLLCR